MRRKAVKLLDKLTKIVIILAVMGCLGFAYTLLPHSAPVVTAADVTEAARITRDAVLRQGSLSEALPPSIERAPQSVFLTVSNGINAPIIAFAKEADGKSAVMKAMERLYARMGKGFKPRWVRFDLVQKSYPLSEVARPKKGAPREERSIHGFAFDPEATYALLPEEIMARSLMDTDDHFRWEPLSYYLQKRYPAAPQFDFASRKEAAVTVLDLVSRVADDNGIYPVYRGHRVWDEITRVELEPALVLAGNYLTENCKEDGQFTYSYLPKSDAVTDEPYNMLRHAGSVYSLMQLYDLRREPSWREAADRAIAYLLTKIKTCPDKDPGKACLVDDGVIKLGGNALALVALAEYTKMSHDKLHLPLMQKLAKWIVASQAEGGGFAVHMETYKSDGGEESFTSDYYPGEAILGLMRLYQLDGEVRWLEAAHRAALQLITVRDKDKSLTDLYHDNWLLIAIGELYQVRKDPLLLEHVKKISMAIIMAQLQEVPYPDWAGGFYKPPQSTPTATRAEGLAAAFRLINEFDDPALATKIRLSLRDAVRFCMATQHLPERVMYLDTPSRALGGFGQSLVNYKVRIDYVQHNASALLGYYRALEILDRENRQKKASVPVPR